MKKAAYEKYQNKLFPGSSHTWAIQQLKELGNIKTALDIGPGNGLMGDAVSEYLKIKASAVEIDAPTRGKLKDQYSTIYEDLSNVCDKQYDLIILLDILEHVSDESDFLEKVISLLSSSGTIIFSVPNVAHWSVRLLLLFGFFNYTERGILDRTHLRFFTKRSLKKLFAEQSNLEIVISSSSIEPIEFVLPEWTSKTRLFRWLRKQHLKLAQLLPGLFGYQLLYTLRKIA